MFQVASYPSSHFSANRNMHLQSSSLPEVNLPRTLARPPFAEPDPRAIASVAPDLAGVPLEYIKRHLAGQASDMLAATQLLSMPSSLPKARLPSSIDVPVRPTPTQPSSDAFPTHVLAISSSKPSASTPNTPTVASFAAQMSSSAVVPLYPTHALVLAAHCTLVPPLPSSRPSNRAASITLPVVPLAVPDAMTFPHLHAYLHTKRADVLLSQLLGPYLSKSLPPFHPTSSSSSSPSSAAHAYLSQFTSEYVHRLAHALASSEYSQKGPQGALQSLMGHAKLVTKLWQNTCALGVFDNELWGVMDLVWEVLLIALHRVAELQRS